MKTPNKTVQDSIVEVVQIYKALKVQYMHRVIRFILQTPV